MPSAAPRGCKHLRCRKLVQTGERYCEEHRPTYAWSDRRESASKRGYDWAWQQLRKRILLRDSGLCQLCLALDKITAARDVDHIVPKEEGGTDDDENLQSLCRSCHKAKTAQESARGRGRAKV